MLSSIWLVLSCYKFYLRNLDYFITKYEGTSSKTRNRRVISWQTDDNYCSHVVNWGAVPFCPLQYSMTLVCPGASLTVLELRHPWTAALHAFTFHSGTWSSGQQTELNHWPRVSLRLCDKDSQKAKWLPSVVMLALDVSGKSFLGRRVQVQCRCSQSVQANIDFYHSCVRTEKYLPSTPLNTASVSPVPPPAPFDEGNTAPLRVTALTVCTSAPASAMSPPSAVVTASQAGLIAPFQSPGDS